MTSAGELRDGATTRRCHGVRDQDAEGCSSSRPVEWVQLTRVGLRLLGCPRPGCQTPSMVDDPIAAHDEVGFEGAAPNDQDGEAQPSSGDRVGVYKLCAWGPAYNCHRYQTCRLSPLTVSRLHRTALPCRPETGACRNLVQRVSTISKMLFLLVVGNCATARTVTWSGEPWCVRR